MPAWPGADDVDVDAACAWVMRWRSRCSTRAVLRPAIFMFSTRAASSARASATLPTSCIPVIACHWWRRARRCRRRSRRSRASISAASGSWTSDGRLCGIVTEGDVARNLTRNLVGAGGRRHHDAHAEDGEADGACNGRAGDCSNKHSIGALIVVDDDNRPIGLVHFHDLLRIGVA